MAACERCSSLCEAALENHGGSASPGAKPDSALHLSLVSCSSVCSIVASSLAGDLGNAAEMARWCAEVCHTCRDIVSDAKREGQALDEVAASCAECVQACEELAGALLT